MQRESQKDRTILCKYEPTEPGDYRIEVRPSLYKSNRMSVSVCLFIPYLLQNGKPQQPEILRDDFPWDWEGFRLKNIRICRTVSKKIKKTRAFPVRPL